MQNIWKEIYLYYEALRFVENLYGASFAFLLFCGVLSSSSPSDTDSSCELGYCSPVPCIDKWNNEYDNWKLNVNY